MPNYTKLEEKLLGTAERDLTTQSRPPALGALDDAGVYRLIAQLDAAQAGADPAPQADGRSAADLLAVALRRVHAERRKRGLKPQADAGARPAVKAGAKPAAGAKRVPASPARKPAGRAKAEARKNDLRTGSRLVKKRRAKDDPVADTTPAAVPRPVAPAKPAPVADPVATAVVAEPSAKKLARQAARKAAAKTAKAAEKDARKIARKVAKDAEKAAKKAAKQALKDADKAAKKAARKADKAAAKAKPDAPDA